MGPVVGIDLGTTNTVVGVVRDGQAAALADEGGEKLLPSVVSFHPSGNVLVGRGAKERRLIDARNTVYSIKRLIGRAWDSEELRTARTRFPFEMREGPGQAALVVARGETYTLPEISAFVLRKAKALAENALGTPVTRAVITVPANFNDLQRAATKVAGKVAGLEVLRILNEPTAAALAYGYGRNTNERLAIYDFGGGTFDVTLLDLSDNVFEVLATAGNTFLGGDDLDLIIADRIAEQFLRQHRYDPRSDGQVFERVRAAAEHIKLRLSHETSVSLDLKELAHGASGKVLDLTFTMSRTELERIAAPIVGRTFDVCREAMGIARLEPKDFDQVLLVGGSTRIPLVRRRVEEFFQRQALGHISPDEVVAIGAAIQASALSTAERRRVELPAPPRASSRASLSGERGLRPPPIPRRSVPPVGDAPATHPGLQGGATLPGHAAAPWVVPPPGSVANAPPPSTREMGERARAITGHGLGAPPAPALGGAFTPPPPQTTPGLGRARARTGTGLGPVERAHETRILNHPIAVPPAVAAGATLVSAAEAARQAQALAQEAHLPLVGNLDEPTLKQTRSDLQQNTLPIAEVPSQRFPSSLPPALGGARRPEARSSQPDAWPSTLETDEDALPIPSVPVAPPRDWAPEPYAAAAPGASTAPWSAAAPATPPLLLDVTPLTLSVETVSGYCDTIIERNTPVPCERMRPFATATDNQTQVRLRISQGESGRFAENTLLGELELNGLRPAARGAVTIAVSFALDTDGILNVSATDVQTGRATSARVRLVGLPDAAQVGAMIHRQQAQAVL
jgi:molecular chaperone DnaK